MEKASEQIQTDGTSLILVGTYRRGQLDKWKGFYNYPISDDDAFDEATCRCIKELWLFQGVKVQKSFTSEFVGITTRRELIDEYGYPGSLRAHGERYLLFRIKPIAKPSEDGSRKIIVRIADFIKDSPVVARKLKAYLENRHRDCAAKISELPRLLCAQPAERLFVSDKAVQLNFLDQISPDDQAVRDEKSVDVWDCATPVEKSSYLQDDHIVFMNKGSFRHDPGKLTMLDLFCGAGGFSVGCSWAGFEPVFGVDHLAPAMQTWTQNHPNAVGCLGDITKVDPKGVKRMLEEREVSHVNLITGGVPCQGFSRANRKHNDNDERNFLFLEYMKFVETFRPDYIILENVSGMRSTAGGYFERNIKSDMEKLGYDVNVKLCNAADFGVPQIRQRLLFVGVRKNCGLAVHYEFPEGDFKGKYRTVDEALSDLPVLGNNVCSTVYGTAPGNDYQRLMRGEGKVLEIPPPRQLDNHVSPNHPLETIAKIASTRQGEPMYPKFKQRIRLKCDAPSPTQLAGGIRPQFQFGHPTQPRGLTIRERARLQSFPDSYKFYGGIVQERVQTGNAVPPLLVYNIVTPIAKDLRERGRWDV